MKRSSVSKARARLALADAHCLTGERVVNGKVGALSVLNRMRCIQSDPIDVAGRNHDLTLQSRVSDFRAAHLDALLYKDRKLFEYTCKMLSIMPIEAYPVFHGRRRFHAVQDRAFMRENRKVVKEVLDAADAGPVSSRDFDGSKKVHWWGMTKVARVALEKLWLQGRLAVHHREGGIKFYSPVEKVVPRRLLEAEPPDGAEAQMKMTRMICRASRLVSPSRSPEQWYFAGRKSAVVRENLDALVKAGDIFKLEIEDCRGPLYAPAEDADIWKDPPEPAGDTVRFLAPLDPLLWNRALFAEIYGRDYVWEVYKKTHERRWGYYCLPMLFNSEYVGLIEPFLRKKDRTLEIRSLHMFDGIERSKRFALAFADELDRFAAYAGAERVADLTKGKRVSKLIR